MSDWVQSGWPQSASASTRPIEIGTNCLTSSQIDKINKCTYNIDQKLAKTSQGGGEAIKHLEGVCKRPGLDYLPVQNTDGRTYTDANAHRIGLFADHVVKTGKAMHHHKSYDCNESNCRHVEAISRHPKLLLKYGIHVGIHIT